MFNSNKFGEHQIIPMKPIHLVKHTIDSQLIGRSEKPRIINLIKSLQYPRISCVHLKCRSIINKPIMQLGQALLEITNENVKAEKRKKNIVRVGVIRILFISDRDHIAKSVLPQGRTAIIAFSYTSLCSDTWRNAKSKRSFA